MLIQKKISLICAIFTATLLPAQFYLQNFKAVAANPYQALITWTVGGGSISCSNLELQTSLDSFQNFSSIYTYPGVCGANSTDVDFNYTHPYPDIHKKNYYRIYTPVSGYSSIVFVDFGAINGNYNIYPDPLTEYSVLTFDNPTNQNFLLKITNAKGNNNYVFPDIYTAQIPLPKSWFYGGIYFFRLINLETGNFTRGKFIVIE